MVVEYADERRIKEIVEIQILREYAKKRGPRPNIEKITKILTLISLTDRFGYKPLTTKEIVRQIPDMNENVIEDYLAFLIKFPRNRPFLTVDKQTTNSKGVKNTAGAPSNVYKFDLSWLPNFRFINTKLDMILEPVGGASSANKPNSIKINFEDLMQETELIIQRTRLK